jgi:hypothetical protein
VQELTWYAHRSSELQQERFWTTLIERNQLAIDRSGLQRLYDSWRRHARLAQYAIRNASSMLCSSLRPTLSFRCGHLQLAQQQLAWLEEYVRESREELRARQKEKEAKDHRISKLFSLFEQYLQQLEAALKASCSFSPSQKLYTCIRTIIHFSLSLFFLMPVPEEKNALVWAMIARLQNAAEARDLRNGVRAPLPTLLLHPTYHTGLRYKALLSRNSLTFCS